MSKIDPIAFRTLTKKRAMPWIRDMAWDWFVIVMALVCVGTTHTWWSVLLAVFVLGNRQHALAILGHDGTHFTVFKSKSANDWLTNISAFFPVGLTTSGYRNLHFAHHKHMNTGADPELLHRSSKAPQWDLPMTLPLVLKLAALDIFGYSVSDYILIVRFSKPDHVSSYYALALFHLVAISICVACGLWWVPVIWYVALVTTFMMFFRLRTWLEHQGTDDTHRLHLTMLERILFSPHNAWYHYEHHHYPSVPYYSLPALRKILVGEPVVKLSALIKFYHHSAKIRSGTPLKVSTSH